MDSRRSWVVWMPLVGAIAWIVLAASVSVVLVAWGLAVLCGGAAVARASIPESSPLVVRRRAVDVSVLAAFSLALAYLAMTARLG